MSWIHSDDAGKAMDVITSMLRSNLWLKQPASLEQSSAEAANDRRPKRILLRASFGSSTLRSNRHLQKHLRASLLKIYLRMSLWLPSKRLASFEQPLARATSDLRPKRIWSEASFGSSMLRPKRCLKNHLRASLRVISARISFWHWSKSLLDISVHGYLVFLVAEPRVASHACLTSFNVNLPYFRCTL